MSMIYRRKDQYVGLLKECLAAKKDFGNLKYKRDSRGNEYLILSDIIGQTAILDITGYDEEKILHIVATVINGKTPRNIVTDRQERMRIASIGR